MNMKLKLVKALVVFALLLAWRGVAADFTVTTPGAWYNINGQDFNPPLVLTRGRTYTFDINAESDHPFEIITESFEEYTNGISNNNIYFGTLTFTVPLDAPDTLQYICSIHTFGNTISIVDPADFFVTTPGFFYNINGQEENPIITLSRGQTYKFNINAESDHPFKILGADFSDYNDGLSENDISSGTITFSVPTNAPDQLQYICSQHFFGNLINIVNPPSRVKSVAVTPAIVTMKSDKTNGFTVFPQFSSNLTAQTWIRVSGYTNILVNGTNVVTFNRLDPICGPNVFLRLVSTNQ